MQLPLKPKKKLSQFFLTSEKIAQILVKALQINSEEEVLEIGAGTGVLTKYLCQYAKRVYAVEIDIDLVRFLEDLTRQFNNLVVVNADILQFNWQNYQNLKIIGNLPYHLSSKILATLIDNINSWQMAVLTLDENVALKLLKKPEEPQGSILTVLFNLYTECKKILRISPNKFYPSPNVTSIALLIKKRSRPLFNDLNYQKFEQIIRTVFRQPRKTIANNLTMFLKLPKHLLTSFTVINLSRRAEDLTLDEFYKLAKYILQIIKL